MRRWTTAMSVLGVMAAVLAGPPAWADGPGSGPPAVVSVGDSAISGEAGRWAGNTNGDPGTVDALGPTAYWDTPTGEAIPGCHRSRAAEIGIGDGVLSANLACSGARTTTQPFTAGLDFKPGLDFYDDGAGHLGQAAALQAYAAAHDVRMVVVLIGANDYGFADVAQTCVTDWLFSPSWAPHFCATDSTVAARFTPSAQATVTHRVARALRHLRTAMRRAGYADDAWTMLVQTYPSPIPRSWGFRYPQSGYTRQVVGGCGVYDHDADWANDAAIGAMNGSARDGAERSGLRNIRVLDTRYAFYGHRLCERSDGLLEERGLAGWQAAGAADASEWVSQIRTVTTLFGPYQLQEDLHPSYWGQQALRNCVRQAYDGGAPRGGACTPSGGTNALGEPNMALR